MYKLPPTSNFTYNAKFLEDFKQKECEQYGKSLSDLIKDWVSHPSKFRADSNMHRYHYPIEDFVYEIWSLVLPKLRMVYMDWLSIRWSPAPIHQGNRHHGTYCVHEIWGHKKWSSFPTLFLRPIFCNPTGQDIWEHFGPVERRAFYYWVYQGHALEEKMRCVFSPIQSTGHHRYVFELWFQRRYGINSIVVFPELRWVWDPILDQIR